jgi:hypothetical protein
MARNLYALSLLALILLAFSPGLAQTYGKSTEDLVGVFSIEKTIRLGSSSNCFTASEAGEQDPLDASGLQDVRNPMGDAQPPSLAGLSIAPDPPNASVILSVHVLDDQSGMKDGRATFNGPSGAAMKDVRILPQNLTNGTPRDGLYVVKMGIPGVAGEWVLEGLALADAAGNTLALKRADLLRRGMPSGFLVVSSPAQVTLPPSAL